MNNFTTRAITGGVFIATLIFSSLWSLEIIGLLFLFFTIVGTYEYFNIVNHKNDIQVNVYFGYALSIGTFCLTVATHLFDIPIQCFALLIPLALLLFVFELFRLKTSGFNNVLHSLLPTLYIALPFAFFVSSNSFHLESLNDYNGHFYLCFCYALWANDTGAYLLGKSFGKTKLYAKISPNKTWEGTLGGALVSLLVGYLCSLVFNEHSAIHWMSIALIVVVFGSLGDLVESMLKRNFNVKDSGKILPGHGGILDRFDGLLLAAPAVYTFIVLKEFYFSYA